MPIAGIGSTPWVPVNFSVPRAAFLHIKKRIAERKFTQADLQPMWEWAQNKPLVPPADWYKRFPKLILAGRGQYPLTVLDPHMKPWGIRLAAPADLARVQAIITEYMPILEPGLERPVVKIVNQLASGWLGRESWGSSTGVPLATTRMEIQKSILGDDNTLRRVVAHELCHHEEFLLHWAPLTNQQRKIKQRVEVSHGSEWLAIANRFNRRFGADFVSKNSDASYVQEDTGKTFFLLVLAYPPNSGRFVFSVAVNPSVKQVDYIKARTAQREQGDETARLFKSGDKALFDMGASIGKGWGRPNSPESEAKLKQLWESGTQVEAPAGKAIGVTKKQLEEKEREAIWTSQRTARKIVYELRQAGWTDEAIKEALKSKMGQAEATRKSPAFADIFRNGIRLDRADYYDRIIRAAQEWVEHPVPEMHGLPKTARTASRLKDIVRLRAEETYKRVERNLPEEGLGIENNPSPRGHGSDGWTPLHDSDSNSVTAGKKEWLGLALAPFLMSHPGKTQPDQKPATPTKAAPQSLSEIVDHLPKDYKDEDVIDRRHGEKPSLGEKARDVYLDVLRDYHQSFDKDRNATPEELEQELKHGPTKFTGPASTAKPTVGKTAVGKFPIGTVQTDLPDESEAAVAIQDARDQIDIEDLVGRGTDIGETHITVRYGLLGGITAAAEDYLRSLEPFTATLHATDSFPPSASSAGAAVIIAPVESEELHQINEKLAELAEFKPADFEYKPHATIAYVDPGSVDRYVGINTTAGKTFVISEVKVVSGTGEQMTIPFSGKVKQAALPPVETNMAWVETGLLSLHRLIKQELSGGDISDSMLQSLFDEAFRGFVTLVYKGDKLPWGERADIAQYLSGASYDAASPQDPFEVIMHPGAGYDFGLTVSRDLTSFWDRFAARFTAFMVHEQTHDFQFNRMRTRHRKIDPTGKTLNDTLDRFDKAYSKTDGVVYLSNQVEIAAHARQAVQELRAHGDTDNQILIQVRNSSLWSTAAHYSSAFRKYNQLRIRRPDVGPSVFRTFLRNVVRALPADANKPVSKEDMKIWEELSPTRFDEPGKTTKRPKLLQPKAKPVAAARIPKLLVKAAKPHDYPSRDSDGTKADVDALMEHRSFGTGKRWRGEWIYERDKNDRVLTVSFKDGKVDWVTMTYADGYHEGKPDTRKGWQGVWDFAQTYGD